MQQFKMGEDAYKILRKRWLTTIFPMAALAAAIGVTIQMASGQSDKYALLFVIPIVGGMIGLNIYRTLKRQKKFLSVFSVTISDDQITREQLNSPPLSISFMEIKEITKTKKGSFIIRGLHRNDVIQIPYMIEDPGKLEACLTALAPVAVSQKEVQKRNIRFLLFALVIGMMIAVYSVTDKLVVGLCGLGVIGFFGWAAYEVLSNKNISPKTKRSLWFFIPIIGSILWIVYEKLTGDWNI
jgi:hypothetical protein